MWDGVRGAIDEMRSDGSEATSSICQRLVGDDAAENEAGQMRRHCGRRVCILSIRILKQFRGEEIYSDCDGSAVEW